VGTKLMIARLLDRHEAVGIDIVNHCVNDILCCGATPLFFQDYIAMGKIEPLKVEAIARGIASACREVGCALIGGETAEMPGMYGTADYDLVGFIVGVVERSKIITGEKIAAGDVVLGLPSNGLHTNGYSLVRRVFGMESPALNTFYPELGSTLADELMRPHRAYYRELKPLLPLLKGMAHITGGGLIDNLPRVLPAGLAARLHRRSWLEPPVFRLISERGGVAEKEMLHVFNMGIGMALVSSPDDSRQILEELKEAKIIGQVVKQESTERVIIQE
jgi:phosphoribosylformylglycinamidine cyclo-ligase